MMTPRSPRSRMRRRSGAMKAWRIAPRRSFHLLKHLEPLAVDWDDDPAQYGPEQVLLRPEVVVDRRQVYPRLPGHSTERGAREAVCREEPLRGVQYPFF